MFFRSMYVLLFLAMISGQARASVTGYVRDADGNPVADASVTFTNENDSSETYDAVTGATGKYTIEMSTSVDEAAPEAFHLGQNFPNPFNPSTTIPFTLDRDTHVSLAVYNMSGQHVATLLNDQMSSGMHRVVWNGIADDGVKVAAGIYLYRMRAGGQAMAGKMTLLDGGSNSGGGAPVAGVGMAFKAARPSAETFRVDITGEDIELYSQSGITLEDGSTLDFTVVRKAMEPVDGRYTMPKSIKTDPQFFDFSTGVSTEALSPLDSWDIAFENAMMGVGIDLNFGKASRAYNTGSTDFDAVALTEEIEGAEYVLDAPWNDPSAVAIDGWFTMPQMGVIESKQEVYVIASNSDDGTVYSKLQITGYADGEYVFRFAALPDGETVEASVAKGGDTHWKYYSFADRAEVDFEPATGEWDLFFGPIFFEMGDMGYMPIGKIIPNNGSGVKVAVAAETALADFVPSSVSGDLQEVFEVPDWYETEGMPPEYVYPVQTFLVQTTEAKYAAFQILSYKSAGVSGFPTFDFKFNVEE